MKNILDTFILNTELYYLCNELNTKKQIINV